jgi:N-acetyl sugar amidotransferase
MLIYDEEKLKMDWAVNGNRQYQQCSLSVMDTIADPDIRFDENGICNYYYEYLEAERTQTLSGEEGTKKLKAIVDEIKKEGKNNQYDCILGLSGGADSTYLAWLAKQEGLRPLLVHFDYGWNTELAIQNIENAVKILGLNLFTYVIDWEEFKELQRSYFKASVLDLDVPADHMIFGALFNTADKFNIKYMLSGNNVWTEITLPKSWNYNKFDLVNLKTIHRTYGKRRFKKLPALGLWHFANYQLIKKIKSVQLLNYVRYKKEDIKTLIAKELKWRDYGGKHHESVFTRFYQGYILPNKFHIDKRKAHLSNLIFAGQLTKKEALNELSRPSYDPILQLEDKKYVAKKLGFSDEEFDEILTLPNKSHEDFDTDKPQRELYFRIMRMIKPATSLIRKFT